MDQLGPTCIVPGKPIQQAIEMVVRLGPALRREAGRFVQHECARVLVDDHLADQVLLLGSEQFTLAFGRTRAGGRSVRRGKLDRLPGLDTVARRRLLAVDAQRSSSRPSRDDVEADVGRVPLEPAVQADAVIVLGYGEFARFGHPRALSPANSNSRTLAAGACRSGPSPWALPTGQ